MLEASGGYPRAERIGRLGASRLCGCPSRRGGDTKARARWWGEQQEPKGQPKMIQMLLRVTALRRGGATRGMVFRRGWLALAAVGLLFHAGLSRAKPFVACSPGQFELQANDQSGTPTGDEVVITGSQVSLVTSSFTCPPLRGRFFHQKKGTRLLVRWPS